MAPYLKLKIEKHIPHIYFYSNDGSEKRLTNVDENILNEILEISKLLGFQVENLSDEEQLNNILEIVSESDSNIELKAPNINSNSVEFNLNKTLKTSIDEVLSLENEYEGIEMGDDVRAELERNRNVDILASLTDMLYDIIIAKTLLAAYDLEINDIHLENAHNYARFNERMGMELQKLGLEFTIE